MRADLWPKLRVDWRVRGRELARVAGEEEVDDEVVDLRGGIVVVVVAVV